MRSPIPIRYRDWLRTSLDSWLLARAPETADQRVAAAEREYTRRTSRAACHSYAAACPVASVESDAYGLREVRLDAENAVLAGIHFRGMQTAWPFVGVFAQSRVFMPDERAAIHSALIAEFSAFAPRASWWWVSGPSAEVHNGRADQHLVMGRLDELAPRTAAELPESWRLQRIDVAEQVTDDFAVLYAAFHEARPDLLPHVPPSDPTDLAPCAAAGGLWAAIERGDVVALFAARPSTEHGVQGWLVQDIVVSAACMGRGLGAAFELAVLRRLDDKRAPWVTGTISAHNVPSLRTAHAVGRRSVGSWFFLDA